MKFLWELRKENAKEYGGKAANLGELHAIPGCRVPEGIVVRPGDNINDSDWWRSWYGKRAHWAVRSSGISEDGGGASFAGQHLTILDLTHARVPDAIEKCRASVVASTEYADAIGVKREIEIAVIVQQMVPAVWAGVLFTHHPDNKGNRGVLEAVRGLGNGLVDGTKKPDVVIDVDVNNPESLDYNSRVWINVVQLGRNIFRHFQRPMDIEWATCGSGVWCLQARPITGFSANPFTIGRGVGNGVVRGVVQRRPSTGNFIEGNVLVTTMTKPNMVKDMMKATAIVTEVGGRTCHAAIVARELGKPCVVGLAGAAILRDGQIVEVNSATGTVIVVE